jgi:hypothetical protein
MINNEKIRGHQDRIKKLKARLKSTTDNKKKEMLRLKIRIEENRIKIERLK